MRSRLIILAVSGISICSVSAEDPPEKEPVSADVVVFQRNAGPSPGAGYKRLPEDLRLGSKVYSLPPDVSWQDLRSRITAGEKPTDFPLVFSGELKFPDGERHWVAAQLALRLTGDGFAGPSPVIHCDLFVIDRSDDQKPKLLWRGSQFLGTMQGAKLHHGISVAGKPGSFSVKIEDGGGGSAVRTLTFQTAADLQVKMVDERK